MNRDEVLRYSGQKQEKSKAFRIFSFIMGIISIAAFVGAVVLLFILPFDFHQKTGSAIDFLKDEYLYLASKGLCGYVILGIAMAGIAVCAAYYIIGIVAMFKPKFRTGNNVGVAFPLGALVVLGMSATALKIRHGLNSVSFDILCYALIGALVVRFLYSFVVIIAGSFGWEKSTKRLSVVNVVGLLTSLVAIAVIIFLCTVNIAGDFINITAKMRGESEALAEIYPDYNHHFVPNLKAKDCVVGADNLKFTFATLFEGFKGEYLLNFAWGVVSLIKDFRITGIFAVLSLLALAWIFVEFARTLGITIVNIFKVFFGDNYVRGSKYFSKTSPLVSPLWLATLPLLINMFDFIVNGFTFTNGLLMNIIAFVIVLVLTIIYYTLTFKDKVRVAKELVTEEMAKVVEEETVIDETEEEVEEVAEKSEEIVAEEPVEEVIEEVAEEPEEIVAEEPVEEVVEEPVEFDGLILDIEEPEETKDEEKVIEVEEKVEKKEEEPKVEEPKEEPKKEQPAAPQFATPFIPQGYPFMGVPMQYTTPNNPTVICVPYPQPVQQQTQPIYIPVYGGQSMCGPMCSQFCNQMCQMCKGNAPVAPAQPASAPAPAPAPAPVEEKAEEPVVNPFAIPKKTLDEKYTELNATDKNYYKQIINYAMGKVGAKRNKGTYVDSVYYGRDLLVKVQIKQAKIVCQFSLIDFKAKEMLKKGKFGAKQEQTIVKVKDKATFDAVKRSIDMSYQLALEAKEERHQEQLRKRREARAAKK